MEQCLSTYLFMIRKVVKELIKTGRDQGFITQDDILDIFPDAEDRIEKTRDFLSRGIHA